MTAAERRQAAGNWRKSMAPVYARRTVEPQPYSIAAGCGGTKDPETGVWAIPMQNYAWLQTASYAPRYTPRRSGQIRRHHAIQMDASLLKTTHFTERLEAQFGFEAFNVLNHNYFGRDQVNQNPNDPNFGTIFPATVSTQNLLPRQIQGRMKVIW